MKKSIISKLVAAVSAVALCVPMFLSNPVTVSASVSSNRPVPGNVCNQTGSSVSDNGVAKAAGSDYSASAVAAVNPGNLVVSSFKTIKSTIEGIYSIRTVNGVAITSSVEEVAAAAGLSEADLAAGTKVKFYICDSYDKEAKKALASYAAENGKTVVAYVNVDLYSITKKGAVAAVKSTNKPVNMVMGIPGRYAKADNSFSVIAMDANGNPVVMNDMDTDAKTVTVDASNFGVYAIVY